MRQDQKIWNIKTCFTNAVEFGWHHIVKISTDCLERVYSVWGYLCILKLVEIAKVGKKGWGTSVCKALWWKSRAETIPSTGRLDRLDKRHQLMGTTCTRCVV